MAGTASGILLFYWFPNFCRLFHALIPPSIVSCFLLTIVISTDFPYSNLSKFLYFDMSLVNLNLTLNTDRAINKIAFCSAVVAGFAYVGYSVCRTAFSRRRRGRGDDESPHRSVFLRRLSQTTQTDGLMGEFFTDGPPKIVLRPKSVQERIRDLNMQARQFASAVTAIQTNTNYKLNGVSGRSLQVHTITTCWWNILLF